MATRKITDLPLATVINDDDTFHISQSSVDKRGDFRFVKDQILLETQPLVDQAEQAADNAEQTFEDFNDKYYGALAADPANAPSGAPSEVGDEYFNTVENVRKTYNGSSWQLSTANADNISYDNTTSDLAAINVQDAIDEVVENTSIVASASRNQVLNQDPLSQGEASRNGVGIRSYTGNGTSQPLSVSVDLDTGDFGGLVWIKERTQVRDNFLFDTVRGATTYLRSNSTAAENTVAGTLDSFDATGFTVGANVVVNENAENFAAWCFQTTKVDTGLTNRNKAYTCHFNSDLGFSIVGYEGDGSEGHEIPHNLGRAPDLSIFKNRDTVTDWPVVFGNYSERMDLNLTGAAAAIADMLSTDTTISLNAFSSINNSADNMISYHFANTPGLIKVGKYIGTGAAGNYVSTESESGKGDGFKPALVLIKRLTNAGSNWEIYDSARPDGTLFPSSDAAEQSSDNLDFVDDGFVLKVTGSGRNALNDEYLFLAIAESAFSGGLANTTYDYATSPDEVTINQDTLISFAEGFNANGEVNVQEQVGASTTFTVPASNENKHFYIYKDKAGSYGVTEYRPLEEQDYFGVHSPLGGDVNLRTTAKHFYYESSTGVVSASGEDSTLLAWKAFGNLADQLVGTNYWAIQSTTTSWLQYKFKEPRVLKSWRLREVNDTTETPRRFTIEGSNDGLNWTAIDSSYAASDYSGNGANLWGDLQDTSANTTAYLYYRINITANNGDATYTSINKLELNTITPSDRYDVVDGKMYDSAGSPISRVYLGEFRTDANNHIIAETLVNYTPAKRKVLDEEVHGDLIVRGSIENPQVATAWCYVDATQNPPLILDGLNVLDIIDVGVGQFEVILDGIDPNRCTAQLSVDQDNCFTNRNTVSGDIKVFLKNSANALVDGVFNLTIFGGKD